MVNLSCPRNQPHNAITLYGIAGITVTCEWMFVCKNAVHKNIITIWTCLNWRTEFRSDPILEFYEFLITYFLWLLKYGLGRYVVVIKKLHFAERALIFAFCGFSGVIYRKDFTKLIGIVSEKLTKSKNNPPKKHRN